MIDDVQPNDCPLALEQEVHYDFFRTPLSELLWEPSWVYSPCNVQNIALTFRVNIAE